MLVEKYIYSSSWKGEGATIDFGSYPTPHPFFDCSKKRGEWICSTLLLLYIAPEMREDDAESLKLFLTLGWAVESVDYGWAECLGDLVASSLVRS